MGLTTTSTCLHRFTRHLRSTNALSQHQSQLGQWATHPLLVCQRRHLLAFASAGIRLPCYTRSISTTHADPTSHEKGSKRTQRMENSFINHSQFISEAPAGAQWGDGEEPVKRRKAQQEELETLPDTGQGRLSSTSSHLFKLILPLWRLDGTRSQDTQTSHSNDASSSSNPNSQTPPIVILLHPSQPLSHVSRLIESSLNNPVPSSISFRSATGPKKEVHQWSDSTDVGDFVKDAANQAKFTIHFVWREGGSNGNGNGGRRVVREEFVDVLVPTFADRTRYLRRRLDSVNGRLKEMEGLKKTCDREAHRGARRMAVSGFGILVLYWGTVARLTFWDFGWDVMEPVTYLSGLSTVICGYLWFLYQGREVSYTSVLDRSISARRQAQYAAHGFDIEQWVDLIAEKKALEKHIRGIRRDYDQDRDEDVDVDDEESNVTEGRAELEGERGAKEGLKDDEKGDKVEDEVVAEEEDRDVKLAKEVQREKANNKNSDD